MPPVFRVRGALPRRRPAFRTLPTRRPGAVRRPGFAAAALLILLTLGCQAPDEEIHLAPFFSRHTAPDYDHTEAMGGIFRREERSGELEWALSPFFWRKVHRDGRREADFIWPLGRAEHDPARPRTFARLFPVFWREAETRPDGIEEVDWSFLFPFFWGGSASDGSENYFAFFPFFGTLKNFFTYDEINFILWPFFWSNKKGERNSYHVLWPFFGWQTGSEIGWRFWPFYGEAEVPGKYKRFYVMWPFYHETHEELDKKHPRHGWLLLPLYGRMTQDDYTATTVLWPVFGTAERPSTGYKAWQAWPLIKFEKSARPGVTQVDRILPFYLHYEDEHTEYSSYLWPIFWQREDRFGGMERDIFYALPFYWSSRVKREDGVVEQNVRVWPLLRYDSSTAGSERLVSLAPGMELVLDPEAISRNWGFLFEIWSMRRDGMGMPRDERLWLNMFHGSQSAGHERWSIPFLGGVWTEPDGTNHYSWLMGLLRWKDGPDGGFEDPAFPGPGWPDLHKLPAARPGDPLSLHAAMMADSMDGEISSAVRWKAFPAPWEDLPPQPEETAEVPPEPAAEGEEP